MPGTQIIFTGMNRTVSDFHPSGACEEIVNLRPTDTGLRPVRPHKVIASNVQFTDYWTHRVGTKVNRIARVPVNGGFEYQLVTDAGAKIQTLVFIPADADDHFAILGNMVVISCKGIRETYVFRFDDPLYTAINDKLPYITTSYSADDAQIFDTRGATFPTDNGASSVASVKEYIASGNNAIMQLNKEYCFGTVMVALSWHTKDGKDYSTFYWDMVSEAADANFAEAATAKYGWSNLIDYYDTETLQYTPGACWPTFTDPRSYIALVGSKLQLTLHTTLPADFDAEGSMLESLNIWTSKPILPYDIAQATIIISQNGDLVRAYVDPTSAYNQNPESSLLYLQKRIPLDELLAGDVVVDMEFGGDLLAANKTLEVDSGVIERYGTMLQYNKRLHYYDSVVTRKVWSDSGIFTLDPSSISYLIYLTVQEEGKDKIIRIPGQYVLVSGKTLNDVIVPYIKATRLWWQKANDPSDITYVDLTPSDRYNYSYAFDAEIKTSEDISGTLANAPIRDYVEEYEYQDLTVTEQMNPFVFDIDHSYRFPGRILDVQTQLVSASDVAFGTEPLNVFTDAGTYALMLGTGTTLYGNIAMVNALVSLGNSVTTKYGTFILAAGGLWMIAGRNTTLVSEALREGPHREVCANKDYLTLTRSNLLYDIEKEVPPTQPTLLQDVPFRTYVSTGARLAFDPYEEALIVSNRSYGYSYVLSLKYRQWYKISGFLTQSYSGDTVILQHTVLAMATAKSSCQMTITDVGSASTSATVSIGPQWGDSFTVNAVTQWTPAQVAGEIADLINVDSQCPVAATVSGKTLTLVAKEGGAGGNELTVGITTTTPGVISYEATGFSGGGTEYVNDTIDVIDLEQTGNGPVKVHVQSRPISPDQYAYTHIHRIVQMVKARLTSSHNLTLCLYGSDDLTDWELLSCSQRTDVNLSQIRNTSSRRSWRYYTIVFGGKVPYDTDFGPVIIDHTPQIRRIG